jgi:hypothetical protein
MCFVKEVKTMPKSKFKKGELVEPIPAEEEVVVPSTKVKATPVVSKKRQAAIQISEDKVYAALQKVSPAKITALYENYDKTGLEAFTAPKVKTAIRAKALVMAKEGKLQAVHENGKRQFTFELVVA